MDEEYIIEGVVDSIRYRNDDNGYTVFYVTEDESDNDAFACVGYLPSLNVGESVRITGNLIYHPTYGEQIKVESCEQTVPTDVKGIERYLASGLIKGVRKRMAAHIVKHFGEDTFRVITECPERLAEIHGISEKKAKEIGEIFRQQAEMRDVIVFLQKYGVSPNSAVNIYKRYKSKTVTIVKANPYILADEVWGIGFMTADKIAFSMGVAADSPYRIEAGIKYVLNSILLDGSVYLPIEELMDRVCKLLSAQGELIGEIITRMHIENQLFVERKTDETRVYLNHSYYNESYVAKKLVSLSKFKPRVKVDYDIEISCMEKYNGIEFAKEQRKAIKSALTNGVMVITGGPGTGKTTIINAIIEILKAEGMEVKLAAPTGKAAKRMSVATGSEAQTIHRLLGSTYTEDEKKRVFEHDEDNPIEADAIIIDESSMIDISLMYYLLKAIVEGTRLVIVGDVDQLPSVGAGNVLKDIIDSDIVPVIRLKEVFRQAKESYIITNAHRINSGNMPVITKDTTDFLFKISNTSKEVVESIIGFVTDVLPKQLKSRDISDIQVLAPMRKSPTGVEELNKVLQSVLNPPESGKQEYEHRNRVFRIGDKVMQIKNNYDISWSIIKNGTITEVGLGIFNGDEGRVSYIDKGNQKIHVLFDGEKTVKYDYSQLDELELSYAVTIHKSQGSEYRAVVIPVFNGPPMLFTRNLIYTGITRAKEIVVLVGVPESLKRMIANNRESGRYTALAERLKMFAEI